MTGGIFLVGSDGQLVEMSETAYDSEDLLQELLARYPNLLAGDQMNSEEPRRWLLVTREMGLPSDVAEGTRWSVDHLYLDQDGIPTLVEVKRSSDTRLRREVVGQLLEYAANAISYWPIERIVAELEKRCEREQLSIEAALEEVLVAVEDPNEYWERVRTNLQAGRVRLVFVADAIPRELRRIVEFLNQQMSPADVLAVEVKRYEGKGLQTFVPRVIGLSERKTPATVSRAKRKWNEVDFMAELSARAGELAVQGTTALLRDLRSIPDLEVWWGEGAIEGAFVARIVHRSVKHQLLSVRTTGMLDLYFGAIRNKAPFQDANARQALVDRLRKIDAVAFANLSIDKCPTAPVADFLRPEARREYISVLRWMIEEIRKT